MPIKTIAFEVNFLLLFSSVHSFTLKIKNMEVTPQALEEFKRIYHKEFGEEISGDEALEMAQRVLTFFSLIYRPLPPDQEDPFKSDNGDF